MSKALLALIARKAEKAMGNSCEEWIKAWLNIVKLHGASLPLAGLQLWVGICEPYALASLRKKIEQAESEWLKLQNELV